MALTRLKPSRPSTGNSRSVKTRSRTLCPWVAVAALFGFLSVFSARAGYGAEVDEIRAQALMHAMLVRSIAYAYTIENSTGWKMEGEFWGEGTRYRVNRNDIQGMMVGDKRLAPLQSASAYDDARYQLLSPHQQRLRIQDGNSEANYSVGTPQTYLYLWLQESGKPFRWDSALSHSAWEQKFKDARYAGKSEDNGIEVEVVEIPQRLQVKTPCIYQICFAPSLGYLPVKYLRRVEQSDAISTTMVVEEYKTLEVDGKTVAIPTRMQYSETGADGMSLKQSLTLTVAEDSLKVNEPIDESLFKLHADDPGWTYDVDHENRMLAAVELPADPPPKKPRSSSRILIANLSLLVIFAIGFPFYRRFFSAAK